MRAGKRAMCVSARRKVSQLLRLNAAGTLVADVSGVGAVHKKGNCERERTKPMTGRVLCAGPALVE
jgi:hypothetical protein